MNRTQAVARFIVMLALFLVLVVVGWCYVDALSNPDQATARSIKAGMTRAEVVDALGENYDDYSRGTYTATDAIAASMEDGQSITTVCLWKIARSSDVIWVGFNVHGEVVGTRWDR